MPYIDIHNINEDTLYKYTTKLINGRYDIISTNDKGLDDYNTVDALHHSMNWINSSLYNDIQYFYNSYSTYRHSLNGTDLKVILNETTLNSNQKYLNDNYYNLDISNFLEFKGIAINYDYPCNGRLASLEDIFVEYGYDYIVAVDKQYYAVNNTYYYFDPALSSALLFSYEILAKGETYTDEEGIDSSILYDGTTVPTAEQIISGQLYIVIKSGNMPPRKIYFNNLYIPTLFVNDDKYNLKSVYPEKEYKDNIYKYILIDNQSMKLCDITRRQSYGYTIHINGCEFYVGNNDNVSIELRKTGSESPYNYGDLITIYTEKKDISVKFRLYIYACLYNTHQDKEYGSFIAYSENLTYNENELLFTEDGNNSITDFYFFGSCNLGPVSRPRTDEESINLLLCIVPTITIDHCKSPNIVLTPGSDTIGLIYSEEVKDIIVINPVINKIECDVKGIIEDIKSKTIDNPPELSIDDISVNAKNVKDSVEPTINVSYEFGLPYTRTADISKVFDNKVYGLNCHISNIPYSDFETYIVWKNRFKIYFDPISINLSDVEYIPGFFYPNVYEPVWLEEAKIAPVFLIEL